MVEDTFFETYLFDWAEELVDKIAISISEVISREGDNNPTAVATREYEKLTPEKQFLLEYHAAVYWEENRKDVCKGLAIRNIVDVWDSLNFVP
jgi:hypothetical protein